MYLRKSAGMLTLTAALGLMALSPSRAQQTLYSIANGGTTLIRFQSNDPTNVTTIGNFSGANTALNAIDFRPATGELFGYLDSADALYRVNINTGELTLASPSPSGAPTNTSQLGMDFNPTIDRVRIITDSDQNIVFNPGNGATTLGTNVFYGAGDVNQGVDPNIIDMGYSNNVAGLFMTSQQYAIDYGLDALVTVANNAGTLGTVGSLGVDTGLNTGFDIFTTLGGTNTAYALLTPPGGSTSLYTINLGNGQATLVGGLGGSFNQVYSLAVVPAQVPEPGSIALLLGFISAGALAAQRRNARR